MDDDKILFIMTCHDTQLVMLVLNDYILSCTKIAALRNYGGREYIIKLLYVWYENFVCSVQLSQKEAYLTTIMGNLSHKNMEKRLLQ